MGAKRKKSKAAAKLIEKQRNAKKGAKARKGKK